MWEMRLGEGHSDHVGSCLAGLRSTHGDWPPQAQEDNIWKAGWRAVEGV